ncbi:hypothetical protein ACFSSE_06545 [Pedobacter alpinus]|uniref:Uncharacterized protein n=2 Tax=Pedobacter alpinus TaxID=1590643 RepID=A0ABW5TQQ6_9SPHI
MTIYLYAMRIEKRLKIKQMHEFANEHLRSCFPLLPFYEAFDMRINKLSEAFKSLTNYLLSPYCPEDCDLNVSLMNSLRIITCLGKQSPLVGGIQGASATMVNILVINQSYHFSIKSVIYVK